ncbi:hypothetical protein PFISCL1PPCAC_19608 [Pristionchus fissidentatus]|uniref:Rho-GAP domain-containing protein n=1 Tax=Pristionchus fissidentatus TaxID=1538716 RepID=A0AAV5WBW4_9BILA|nr:hypothetical protein PFISCL1PPCAC_19608 [Pristionchus fissidentatus]
MEKEEERGKKKEKEKRDEKSKPKRRSLSLMPRASSSGKGLGKWHRLGVDKEKSVEVVEKRRGIIGEPLDQAIMLDPSFDDIPLPAGLRMAIDYVEEHGLSTEGIYRVSSPVSRLDYLERAMDATAPLHFNDAHEAAGLVKRYLRRLPPPLLPPSISQLAAECVCEWRKGCTCGVSRRVRSAFRLVPRSLRFLFAYVFIHSQNVVRMESSNKMGVAALGLLLQTIMDMEGIAVLLFLINATDRMGVNREETCFIFEDIPFRKLRLPRSVEEIEEWKCNDFQLIEDEMKLQERLVSHLHSQIGYCRELGRPLVPGMEERLWRAQTAQTMLKRRRSKGKMIESRSSPIEERNDDRINMVKEKQLLAVHCMLREDVEEEMMRVANLLWKMKGDEGRKEKEKEGKKEKEGEAEEWKERVKLEEDARDSLLNCIVSLREECAMLRGEIELNQSIERTNRVHPPIRLASLPL